MDYVFRDRPNTLRVFIHAPWEFRVEKSREKISGVMIAIPISILFVVMQKFYVEGVTGGAVKG